MDDHSVWQFDSEQFCFISIRIYRKEGIIQGQGVFL